MTLHAYRSQRVEELVDALASALTASWPDDPFEPLPIVVGSRGMERWLRHELATRLDGLVRVKFLFPRAAFDGAARWLSMRPAADDRAHFWEQVRADETWSGAPLAMRLLTRLRAHLGEPPFARIRDYLGDVGAEVRARELRFVTDVASTVERLLHDRPDDAIAWSAAPASAPKEHVWIATLLADLVTSLDEASPAHRFAELGKLPAADLSRPLFVFGLSTLRPGDKARIAVLARHLDVHLFALAPSSEWWEDIRRASEQRAALRDEEDPEMIAELLADITRKNVMLSANGGPSRDLQLWLETVGYDEPSERPPLDAAPTLLGRLHGFIDAAGDNPRDGEPPPWSENAGCGSLEIHACHGALRQCEALRDELLRRFAKDETLEPRHVLVMTPDLETYAPLVAAVLSRKGGGKSGDAPAIPLHIADLGIRAKNPVADALLRTLELADERVTASRLLDLLMMAPVRARFGLSEEALSDLTTMVAESGIRWAWDARDRARHAQPALDQNTVRFGLERLALGALMHAPPGLGTVASAVGALLPAVPFDLATRERVERFGRLAAACATLERFGRELATPATGREWRKRIEDMLDASTLASNDQAWLRVEVDGQLEEMLPKGVADDLTFDRSAIVSLLGGAFDLPQQGDRAITGAVTVSALEPMRSVPFRVIAILGLDDGAFPRPPTVAAWDPFARARQGEWDRRAIDRHLLLEAILCARDALLLFGTGFEPKRGATVPLSVAVSELSELVAAGVGVPPGQVVIRHPLKPWSEQEFADDRRLPFDRIWSEAALARDADGGVQGLAATHVDAVWPDEEDPPRILDATELANALHKPQKELLGRRLGVALEARDAEVQDREPLEQDTLDTWLVRDRVLAAMGDDGAEPDVEALEGRLRGEGVLPLAAGGRKVLEQCIEEAVEARRRSEEVAGERIGGLTTSCEIGDVTLTAAIHDVRSDGGSQRFVWLTPSGKPNGRVELTGWISLLVAIAAGIPARAAHLVGYKGSTELGAPTPDEARRHLALLVETWRTIRRSTALLFPNLSREVAARAKKSPDASDAELVRAASSAWEGSQHAPGDLDDPYVSALFFEHTIEDLAADAASVVALAKSVWGPLLAATASKKKGGA